MLGDVSKGSESPGRASILCRREVRVGFLKEVLLNVPPQETASSSSSLGRAAVAPLAAGEPARVQGHLKLSWAPRAQGHGVPSSCDPISWGTLRLAACSTNQRVS